MFAGIMALVAAVVGAISAHQTNQDNKGEAQKNRNFQADMANSAHQREVRDLRAAGLNPLLSNNAGAATGSGAQATLQNPLEGLGEQAATIGKNYGDRKKQEADMSFLESQKGLMATQAKALNAQAMQSQAQSAKALMETQVMRKELPKSEVMNDMFQIIKPYSNKLRESITTGSKQFLQKDNPPPIRGPK